MQFHHFLELKGGNVYTTKPAELYKHRIPEPELLLWYAVSPRLIARWRHNPSRGFHGALVSVMNRPLACPTKLTVIDCHYH